MDFNFSLVGGEYREPLWLAVEGGAVRISSIEAFVVKGDMLIAYLQSGREVVVVSTGGEEALQRLMNELEFGENSDWFCVPQPLVK